MAVFKYFTEKGHALAFIRRGVMLLRPLSYFRTLEDEGVRGDARDGVMVYAPPEGLAITKQDGRVITLRGGSFNSSVNQNDIFVYCASNQLSAELAEKFGPFCVEVPEPGMLVRRLRQRAHLTSKFDYDQLAFGKVDYREHSREPGGDWALPERLALIKPEAFAWQDEFRLAVGKWDTMNVENVGLTIQTGPAMVAFEPVAALVVLRVGSLADHAILHHF